MKLSNFVVRQAFVADLKSTDRDGAVGELIDALIAGGAAPTALRDTLVQKIIDREKHGSTGFGRGVAVPHVKHSEIPKMCATIGVSQKGVEFNALDKAPVYSIVLLLSPEDNPDEHLQAMEKIFSHLQKDMFRRFLRQSSTTEEIMDLLQEADSQQLQA